LEAGNLGRFWGVAEEELFLHTMAGLSLGPVLVGVEAVGVEETGFHVVGQVAGNNDFNELTAKFGVQNREDHFDPAMKIAGHEIGASEENQRVASVGEEIDAAVFEEAIDNATNPDGFTDARQTGTEAADAPDQQVDGNAFLGGGVKSVDDFLIHEAVGLDEDARGATGAPVGPFTVDELEKAGSEVEGGDEEFVEVGGFRHAGEDVKEGGCFGSEGGAGSEQAKVGVEAGRAGMVVAGAEMEVGAEMVFLPADDEEHLAMGFQADEAIDHVNAGFLHLFGPGDVVGFIKAGLEFNKNGHLFFVVSGGDQSIEDRGIAAGAVQGHFDGEYRGIGGGVLEEGDDGGEAFVGMVEQDVPLADGLEIGWSPGQGGGEGWGKGGVAQARLIAAGIGDSENLREVDRSGDAVGVLWEEVEVAEKKVFNFDRAVLGNLEADGGTTVSFLELLLDGEEKVLGFLLVDVEFAVPGDADGPGSVDFHPGEDFPDKMADQFGKQEEFLALGMGRGEVDQAGNTARDLNEGVAGGFLGTGFGVKNGQIDGFIQKLGKRVTGVDRERGENGEDIATEGFQGPG